MNQKKQSFVKSKLNFINAEHVARGLLSKNRAHPPPLWLRNNQNKQDIQLMELDSNILNRRQNISDVPNDIQKQKYQDENKIKMKLLSIDDQTQQFLHFRYSDKKFDANINMRDQQFLIEPFHFLNEQSQGFSNTVKLNMKFQKLKSEPNQKNKTQPLNFLSHSVQKRKTKNDQNGPINKKNDMSGLKEVIKKLQSIQNCIKPTLDSFPISKVNLMGNNYQKPRSHSSKLFAPEQNQLCRQVHGLKDKKVKLNSKKIQTQQSQNFCGDLKQWKCYQKKRYKNLNDNLLVIKNEEEELIERLMKNQILKKMRQKQKCNKENENSKKHQDLNLQSDTKYRYVPLSSTIVPFSKISSNHHVSGRSTVRNNASSRHSTNKTPLMSKQKSAQNNKKNYERQKSIIMKQKLKEKIHETQREKCLNLWKVNGVPAKDRKKLIQLLF